jgi:CheY-like chemotaxis protein
LRQVLLNVLVAAIHSVPGGLVRIEAGTHLQGVRVSMQPLGQAVASTAEQTDERNPNLKMARDLLELSGGSMTLTSGENPDYPSSISLTLPAVSQVPVLVVDDNLDALQLFRRYLAGTYYSFIPAREPEQAVALAEALSPGIIVLDVMLPGVDGWELLGRLREHPRIRGTPIIVCTILPQEQLAMALGAADFLRKPVSRATLLSALDRQTEALARGQR